MPDEFFARAQIAHLHSQRLMREARSCTDADRLKAINAEMEVVVKGLETIPEEQLVANLERRRPESKRRWWRRRSDGPTGGQQKP